MPRAEHLILQHPLELQITHIVLIDLIKQAIALAHVATIVGQPILRLIGSVENAVVRHLSIGKVKGLARQQECQAAFKSRSDEFSYACVPSFHA